MYAVLLRWFGTSVRAIRRFLITAMALGFMCLLAAGVAATWSTGRNIAHTASVRHTYEVELAIARASNATEQAEASRRGYILTANPLALANYKKAADTLPGLIDAIDRLSRDNPEQRANVAELRRLTADLQQRRARSIALVSSG